MKKSPLWLRFFFGENGRVNHYSYGIGHADQSLWGLICGIAWPLVGELKLFSMTLMILKLCGVIHIGWKLVALPFIIEVAYHVIERVLSYVANEAKARYDKKELEERRKEYPKRQGYMDTMPDIYEEE